MQRLFLLVFGDAMGVLYASSAARVLCASISRGVMGITVPSRRSQAVLEETTIDRQRFVTRLPYLHDLTMPRIDEDVRGLWGDRAGYF